MNDTKIDFESVKPSHKNIILAWFNEDHVKEFFYGDGVKNTLRNLDLFCQGINNNGSYYNKWYVDASKLFTLDLLIGEKDFLFKGLAHLMIQQFILDQYADADYFIIDPEAENTKAIHVYEKAAFKKVGELCSAFNPKPHIMMRLIVDELRKSL